MMEQFKSYRELDKWFSGTRDVFGYKSLRHFQQSI